MKKNIFTFIAFFFFISIPKSLELPIDVTADAVMVTNIDTNEILFTKNPDKVEMMASLTKIMTAYTALKNIDNLNKKITITEKDLEGLWVYTVAGLKVDDVVTYRDLLYGLMLISGADCAQALAIHISGSVQDFVALMNQEAASLGLRHTHFEDPAGGENENVSTAREMSLLLKEALKNDDFKIIFGTNYYTMSNGLRVVNYTQSYATFHGLDSSLLTGNKSGYTDDAGLLLASTATINNINYMVITCKSAINEYLSNHVLDTYKIYDYLKDLSFKEYDIIKKGTMLHKIPVKNATTSTYYVMADRDIKLTLTEESYKKLNFDYHLADYITNENKIGDNLGFIDILIGDEVVETYHVYLYDEIFIDDRKTSTGFLVIIILLIFLCIILLCINLLITPRKVKIKQTKVRKKAKIPE